MASPMVMPLNVIRQAAEGFLACGALRVGVAVRCAVDQLGALDTALGNAFGRSLVPTLSTELSVLLAQ